VRVFDREQHGPPCCERAHDCDEGDPDRARVGRGAARVLPVKRDRERSSLRLRQVVGDLVEGVPDEVAQPGEGELRLGVARCAGEDPVAPLARRRDAGPEQRRLADACFSLEDEDEPVGVCGLERRDDRRELLVPADDVLDSLGSRLHGWMVVETTGLAQPAGRTNTGGFQVSRGRPGCEARAVPSYLVESYLADSAAARADARDRARRAAELGTGVRYVRTTFLPSDETVFHLFEAPSADVVCAAGRLAALDHQRIVEVVEATAEQAARPLGPGS